VIFIQAQTLHSNGYTIGANGSTGGNTTGDGASGGGGGGTVILSVTNFSDPVSIEAKGGDGGIEDDELISGRCYGEGGGGSGGTIYFSGLQPAGAVSVAGGSKGAKLNSTCSTTTGANGNAGTLVANYSPMESTTLSGCNSTVLAADWVYFKATSANSSILLQWSVLNTTGSYFVVQRWNAGSWIDLTRMPASVNQSEYRFQEFYRTPAIYLYRVKWVSGQSTQYSPIQQVIISGSATQTIIYDATTTLIRVRGIARNETFRIIDLYGNCLYQKQFPTGVEEWQLNSSFLKTGMYIAQTERAVTKFISAR
ncbi:MAG TPA: hypothetical protein VI385_16370, partial [Flavisolibacter sp.]